jgi:O-antigen/teichoic acid export membrane protein
MIRWLVGPEEVGVYAVAARLSEGWYFLPVAIVSSFFPRLIELRADERKYHHRLQQLLDGLFSIALAVALGVTLFAVPLARVIFGPEYAGAGPILAVHIWTAVFIFMRAVISKWILIENLLVLSVVTQGCGAVLNVLLNLILIPSLGGVGAAVATLVSYAAASYFSLLFNSRSRVMFLMMSKAMLAPIRYIHRPSSGRTKRA